MPDDPSHSERLRRTKRAADYPFTYFVINPINRTLVRPLSKTGISPTTITVLSFILAIAAAFGLYQAAQREPLWLYLAPALVFASHILDALDGDLARYTGRASEFGGALDPILDRVGEFLYAGAVGLGVWHATGEHLALIAALVCAAGVQVYYYTTDAQVSRMQQTSAHDVERFSVTGKGNQTTRIKFGLYEPYQYLLALATSFGFGLEALWVFAGAFWLAWTGQLFKMWRIANRAD